MNLRSTLLGAALLALAACGPASNPATDAGTPADAGPPPCDDKPGVICTWAGTGEAGFNGDGKDLRASMLYWPVDVSFDKSNRGYLLDFNNHKVRRVKADKTLETVVGTDFPGDGDADQADLKNPAGVLGTAVSLNHPTDVVFGPSDGLVYVASWHNHKIRVLDPVTGIVKVFAGSLPGFLGDGGPAQDARLNQNSKLAFDDKGQLYVLDQKNQRVRRIATDAARTITSPIGVGTSGFSGDGQAPVDAKLAFEAGGAPEPNGALAFDAIGNLYIADTKNHRIRKVDFKTSAGVITTIAGTGEAGFSGDGGKAVAARLSSPRDLAIGPDNRLYVADTDNNAVRAISLDSQATITTVAGTGEAGYSGDNGDATKAKLKRPYGIAFDAQGALYVADTYNQRIRRIGK